MFLILQTRLSVPNTQPCDWGQTAHHENISSSKKSAMFFSNMSLTSTMALKINCSLMAVCLLMIPWPWIECIQWCLPCVSLSLRSVFSGTGARERLYVWPWQQTWSETLLHSVNMALCALSFVHHGCLPPASSAMLMIHMLMSRTLSYWLLLEQL